MAQQDKQSNRNSEYINPYEVTPDKPFHIAFLREITDQYEAGEISYGKMLEMLNEVAMKWHNSIIGKNEPTISKTETVKTMAQQRLYTEEQVRKVWKAGQEYWKTSGASTTLEELLEHEKQIELPSDEEIDKKAYNWCKVEHDEDGYIRGGDDYDMHMMPSFIAGALWMRDKILNK